MRSIAVEQRELTILACILAGLGIWWYNLQNKPPDLGKGRGPLKAPKLPCSEPPSWAVVESSLLRGGKHIFTARHGHATARFGGKLWLSGGRSYSYAAADMRMTNLNADVWYSDAAEAWSRVAQQLGDFYVQNADAKMRHAKAPWCVYCSLRRW